MTGGAGKLSNGASQRDGNKCVTTESVMRDAVGGMAAEYSAETFTERSICTRLVSAGADVFRQRFLISNEFSAPASRSTIQKRIERRDPSFSQHNTNGEATSHSLIVAAVIKKKRRWLIGCGAFSIFENVQSEECVTWYKQSSLVSVALNFAHAHRGALALRGAEALPARSRVSSVAVAGDSAGCLPR